MHTKISILGAREHNLKDIDVEIPAKELVVITGLSGSGKSSLAFDTLYAEGQRRYMETFSNYARQFIGQLERPDVDKIDGLSPVISIEQKTISKNPRSTVGTITEIYDFLRLLYARCSIAYSYRTQEKMISYTVDEINKFILQKFEGQKILILSPVIKSRKGHYRELFEKIIKQGFINVRVNGEILELTHGMRLDRYKTHDIEIVIDKLKVNSKYQKRFEESIKIALKYGEGVLMINKVEKNEIHYFSQKLMCPTTGIAYPFPEPNSFSFNSPKGACQECKGLGVYDQVKIDTIIPNRNISVKQGGITPLGLDKHNSSYKQIQLIALKYDFNLSEPISKMPEEMLNEILYGSVGKISKHIKYMGITKDYNIDFQGICNIILESTKGKASTVRWANEYIQKSPCKKCNGTRLNEQSLSFKIADKNIAELSELDISELYTFICDVEKHFTKKQTKIGKEVLKELKTRIKFLLDIGLDYLCLSRSAKTLSGGEAQRIRLASQIGMQLMGVLYILDEPSIGLHQRDNTKLIQSLKNLRDIGNSVLVVEHDKEIMEEADYILDMGPYAGKNGGKIVAKGSYEQILKNHTLTAQYLNENKKIEIPKQRRKGTGEKIVLKGAIGNNLKSIDVDFPLGTMICVTGVSGSGKSTLINETLYPILNREIYKAIKEPLPYKSIKGLEYIDKVIGVDQSPIGRTPRSNPATYTGVLTEIRGLFANTSEAKIRGYKGGRFSFNVKGGRCETCKGGGLKMIEMNFLPDVYVPCEDCFGKRFNRETLEIRYKGKNIADVLEMTVDVAVDFFEKIPKIYRKLKILKDVGLNYITIGQQSTTLSGGEAQRVKLATELSKRDTGKTLFILDEPTTGLHFEDIKVLMEILQKLVDMGNTVLLIEHNLDVIKVSDYIIDIGLEGGQKGGKLLCIGTPEEIIKHKKSYTAKYLKKELRGKF